MRYASIIACLLPLLGALPAQSAVTQADLDALLDSTVHGWKFMLGEVPGAEAPDFDDTAWATVDVGHRWWPHDSSCWYRKRITLPETISGIPIEGSTIRLHVGMDNEAKAYVNGEFKQEFEWADGDFVIAENAQPGAVVVVALQGTNGPGYGSLYKACLTSDANADVVEALQALNDDYENVNSHIPYGTRKDTPRWAGLVYNSRQRIDLEAYRAGDKEAFLESVDEAKAFLFSGALTFEEDLAKTGEVLGKIEKVIAEGRELGCQMAYEGIDARVIKSFIGYARDDFDDHLPLHTLRALRTAQYLYTIADEAFVRANAVRWNPEFDIKVPQYKTGRAAIRDGVFYQDEHPIFFTGVGHFGQVRKDVPILNEYGLNIIQMEIGPNSVVTGPDTVDDTAIREDILKTLDRAAENNVAVNLLISPHYFPEWALETYPQLKECGLGFMRNCIDAPESRAIYERFLRTLMPVIAKHPALHSICLSNEPQYDGRCASSLALYRQWLEKKHGAIEAVNGLYGTAFASFGEAAFPEGTDNYAQHYDYCRFNQDRFLAFHEFLAGLVHEFDPELPVHVKVMSHAFGDTGRFEVGVDYERFTQIGAIAGNDCVQLFVGAQDGEFLQRWQDMALNYTLQRCVAPSAPVFNSEDHIISDGDTRFIPSSHIRTAYWTQALHGQGAATTWVWERSQGGDFANNILTRANCVRALGRIALDLNRLAPELCALQDAKSDMAILYAFSSMLPSNAFTEEAAAAFEGAYFADTVPAFVTEAQVAAGKLGEYKVLVVPAASHVPEAVFKAVQAFIEGGGTVMTAGASFTHDEYGRPREARLAETGQGRLAVYPDSLSAHAYRDVLDDLLTDAGSERPIRLQGAYAEPVWGVNLRTVEHEGRRLVSLVNYGREAKEIVLDMAAHNPKATNLFTGREVTFPFALKPLDPVLLAIE